MCNNTFGIDGLRCIYPFLKHSPNLSTLNFDRNSEFLGTHGFNNECFEWVIRTLHELSPKVDRLFYRHCNATDISALETYTLSNLQYLGLDGNSIGREGCITLSNLLQKEDTRLKYLDLDNTGIEDEDVELIASSLKHNTTLNRLWLEGNNLSHDAYVTLLKLLVDVSSIESTYTSNHTLTELNLGLYVDSIQSALHTNRYDLMKLLGQKLSGIS